MSNIELKSVIKSYKDFTLGPVSLKLGSGITALLGANGAGKTTLLRILVGITRPSAGYLIVEGGNPDRDPGEAGYLPQDFSGPRNVRVADYLRFVAWCRSSRKHAISEADVNSALNMVELMPQKDSKFRELSGGMIRRVGIAQALLQEASVIILDEPTVGLDPIQRLQLRDLLVKLSKTRAIVLSTHLSEDVAAVADHVAVLNDGTVSFFGDVSEFAEIGGSNDKDGAAVEAGFMSVVNRVGRERA